MKGLNRTRVFVWTETVNGVKTQRVCAGDSFADAGRAFGVSPLVFWLRGHHLSTREARKVALSDPGVVFSRPAADKSAAFMRE